MNLQDAFRSFEDAAARLTDLQQQLRNRVGHLEEELLDANQELEAVLDAVSDGIAVVDRSGRLLRGNTAFTTLGLDESERLEIGRQVGIAGVTCLRRTGARGELRDFTIASSPVGDAGEHAVWTVHDITDIRKQEADSGRKSRLEALGRMAAELAHEVRNPLGGMRLFAGLLHDDLELQPTQREMAGRILHCIGGLESTVSNLLDFANPGSVRRRPADLSQLFDDVEALLRPACAARQVELRIRRPEGPFERTVDPESIRQVLLNLAGNALSAVEEKGRIELRLASSSTEDSKPGNSGTEIVCTDDGRGIAADDLGRVFDPFFSKTEGGSGLGLAIVHRIVEEHDGRLALESQEGTGTTVKIHLPTTRFDAATEAFAVSEDHAHA